MNHIQIHTSFEKHDHIIEFVGLLLYRWIYAIVLQSAEYDLLHAVTMDRFEDKQIFFEFFHQKNCRNNQWNGTLFTNIQIYNIVIIFSRYI